MDGGIKKADDFVSHKTFAEAAREKGMDEILVFGVAEGMEKHEEHLPVGLGDHE